MNLLSDAVPEQVTMTDINTVVFTFDLEKHPDLGRTVNHDMASFMVSYPAVAGYSIAMMPGRLVVQVQGIINPEIVSQSPFSQ